MSVPPSPTSYVNDRVALLGYFDQLADYANTRSPLGNIVTKEVIPNYSRYGNSLSIYRIGNPNGGRVMFDAACHGDERVNCDLLYFYMRWLLTSGHLRAEEILQNNWTILVPIVNVDGFPSRRLTYATPYGVDLNRNFTYEWGEPAGTGGGQCRDPTKLGITCTISTIPLCCDGAQIYCGSKPLSEPESLKYRDIWNRYRPYHYLNLHTFGSVTLWDTPHFNTNGLRTQKTQPVFDRYKNEIAPEFGATPVVSYLASDGGKGNFPGEAYYNFGSIGWSNETVQSNPVDYNDIPTTVFNQWLPLLVTLSLESAYIPLPSFNWYWLLSIPIFFLGGYCFYKKYMHQKR